MRMDAKVALSLVLIGFTGPGGRESHYPSNGQGPVLDHPAEQSPTAWRVSAAPSLVIGAGGGSDHEFFRLVAAARLRDGRIVALVEASVRVFDSSGRPLRTIGRAGQGPGEFVRPSHLQIGPSDSLFVFDAGTQRLSVFDTSGALLRDARIQGSYAVTGAVGRFTDGRWFAKGEDQLVSVGTGSMARDTVSFAHLTPEMAWGARLAAVPGAFTSAMTAAGRRGVRQAPFSPQVLWHVHGRCLYTASGDSPEVTVTRSDGSRVATLTLHERPRRPTRADWDAWVEFMGQPVPREQMADFRMLVEGIPRMDVLPRVGGLIVDATGLVWLQEYSTPLGEGTNIRVVDPSGTTVARLEIPEGIRLLDVGRDYIFGRRLSGMNEEVLVRYDLTRTSLPSGTGPHPQCR